MEFTPPPKGSGNLLLSATSDFNHFLKTFVFRDPMEDLPLFSPSAQATVVDTLTVASLEVPMYTNQFWTPKQRQAANLHEISYRGCFKPQLPAFFIDLLSRPGDVVYDPFSGRGTTAIEAALKGRQVVANDVNPLSALLARPRLRPADLDALHERLRTLPMSQSIRPDRDLSMFFHPGTLGEIVAIREYLAHRQAEGREDHLDRWIRMVATNRLTGHSPGFFSVYTLPPNQAVSPERQIKINEKRRQTPPYRDTRAIIWKKSCGLLKGLEDSQRRALSSADAQALFLTSDARHTSEIPPASVQLTVTSPPFLDVVQYSPDNWLRCWFNRIDDREVGRNITMTHSVEAWSEVMGQVFAELFRVTRPGGWVCFEVGEVKNGRIKLEQVAAPLGIQAGFVCQGVIINQQEFTKTSNIWGINNNSAGTNTNRIVMFHKD